MGEQQNPILSISMLVSNNRRDTIEKCMESLIPLREAISSELVIVDTGCTDGSIEIARKYADKVISFSWCNDFSTARNAGLFECTGQWFLFLDDDEWFEDVSGLIEFFCGREKEQYDALCYVTRNYGDFAGETYTDAYVCRGVKRTPETRFCGKIHEWLEPIPRAVKQVSDYVHHFGYVYRSEEEKQKHAQRNIVLVEQAVKENPKDIRMCCQLVQEYRLIKRYEEALEECNAMLEKKLFPNNNPFVQYLLLAIPRIYREQGRYEQALEAFEHLEQEKVFVQAIRPAYLHEKAATLIGLKLEDELQQVCAQYLRESKVQSFCQQSEELVMDLASFSSPFVHQVMAEYGVMSVLRSKDTTYASVFFDEIKWKEDKYELVIALIRCYIDGNDSMLLRKYLPSVLAVEGLKGIAYNTLDSMYEQYPEKRKMISEDLELIALTEQLKGVVRSNIAASKTEEAMAILSELAMMIPEDEEVKELLQQV